MVTCIDAATDSQQTLWQFTYHSVLQCWWISPNFSLAALCKLSAWRLHLKIHRSLSAVVARISASTSMLLELSKIIFSHSFICSNSSAIAFFFLDWLPVGLAWFCSSVPNMHFCRAAACYCRHHRCLVENHQSRQCSSMHISCQNWRKQMMLGHIGWYLICLCFPRCSKDWLVTSYCSTLM